jgi:hypothetical protein
VCCRDHGDDDPHRGCDLLDQKQAAVLDHAVVPQWAPLHSGHTEANMKRLINWVLAPFRNPYKAQRPKPAPPCNYDPKGFWVDDFADVPPVNPKEMINDRR